jgi:hypothetical protein
MYLSAVPTDTLAEEVARTSSDFPTSPARMTGSFPSSIAPAWAWQTGDQSLIAASEGPRRSLATQGSTLLIRGPAAASVENVLLIYSHCAFSLQAIFVACH